MEIYTVGRIRDCTDTIKLNICMVLGKWQHIKLPKRPPTKGETLAKAMLTMEQEYGVHFLFCHPNEAGAKVVELLEGGCDDDRRTKAVG